MAKAKLYCLLENRPKINETEAEDGHLKEVSLSVSLLCSS